MSLGEKIVFEDKISLHWEKADSKKAIPLLLRKKLNDLS